MNSEDLKEIAVLQQIDAQARARLASVLQEKDYNENQTVFAEGDPGDSMYFIIEGGVRIEKLIQGPSGSRKTLAVLQAGDYFGEMSLVEQKPRSASAITAPNTR